MSDRTTSSAPLRIGIIDLGSNSLRLAVFERHGSALFPLLNERVMCGLARGLSASGRLNRDGAALARVNLRRFAALARSIGVDHLAVLATAAVRDAADGGTFAAEVARENDLPVVIVDGAEEARLTAAGVLAGTPEAEGIVGDLGGGSVELVRVGPRPREETGEETRIGRGLTLPLGPLRLAELGDARAVAATVERVLATAAAPRAKPGQDLYLVGGAARAIARLHMEHARYPLHIVHHYTMGRHEAEAFFDIVGRLSRRSLERITTISRRRLEVVPLAATILRPLVAAVAPQRVVFSAYGLREGYASGLVPPAERTADPLIDGCIAVARRESRFSPDGDGLLGWTRGLFADLPDRVTRLHRAACWLADIAWIEHPDYRAQEAFNRSLRLPLAAITHAERVFVASVLHTRYAGTVDDTVREPTRRLLDAKSAGEVRTLGLVLRLAYTLTGGRTERLAEARLVREGDSLVLEVPRADSLFEGDVVLRRLEAVARSIGAAAVIRRRGERRATASRSS